MAPPMLVHDPSGEVVAEMPAVCLWLGNRFFKPVSAGRRLILAVRKASLAQVAHGGIIAEHFGGIAYGLR